MSTKKTDKTGMQFERDEMIGIFVSLLVAVFFFAALRFDFFHKLFKSDTESTATKSNMVMVGDTKNMGEMMRTLGSAVTKRGKITKLIAEDSKVGTGTEVVNGSLVTVNYIGMTQDGTQFDNSYSKGVPYTFTVGEGAVIAGWDEGLLGMQEGGERILVIPPDLAYGNSQVGTIAPNSTLLFSIELLKVE